MASEDELRNCPTATTTGLCAVCENSIFRSNLFITTLLSPSQPPPPAHSVHADLHKTYEALLLSVAQDCYICTRFHASISPGADLLPAEDGTALFRWNLQLAFPSASNDAVLCLRVRGTMIDRISLYSAQTLSDGGVRGVPAVHAHKGRTDDSASWDTAHQWMRNCLDDHIASISPCDTGSWFPTRLLDISRQDGMIRLIDTREAAPTGPYATLSHCWGMSNIPKTTPDNIAQHRMQIPRLTRTFEDAIGAARKLGLRYLWIDSLCIIQDEPDLSDWVVESAQMCNVYQNAICNLAATASADGNGGLFYERPRLGPCEVTVSSGEYTKTWCLDEDSLFKREIGKSPLLARGWVIQERTLARRVLHFGSRQLFWECDQLCASEDHPNGLPSLVRGSRREVSDMIGMLKASPDPTDPKDHAIAFARVALWNAIIQPFSITKVTKSSDKLPALSGIVKYLNKSTHPGAYHAGIWAQEAHLYLAWARTRNLPSPRLRGEAYRAPSWSWASINNSVAFRMPTRPEALVRIVEMKTTPATADPTGAVLSGYTIARGAMHTIVVRYTENEDRVQYEMNGKLLPKFDINFDEPYSCVFERSSEIQAYVMPLHVDRQLGWDGGPNNGLVALILQESLTECGSYERIGLGTAHGVELPGTLRRIVECPGMLPENFEGKDIGYRVRII